MTRPPPNPKPNLGPVFALAAAAIAGVAVIAGFLIVGGPGHARDQRLDELTGQKIGQLIGVVQCAYEATGIAPTDYSSAAKTLDRDRSASIRLCNGGQRELPVGTGDLPAAPGDITYQATSSTQIKICANFRIAQDETDDARNYMSYGDVYPQLTDEHAAGVHCYALDLVKPVNAQAPLEESFPRVPR